jgi:hypothetical protein
MSAVAHGVVLVANGGAWVGDLADAVEFVIGDAGVLEVLGRAVDGALIGLVSAVAGHQITNRFTSATVSARSLNSVGCTEKESET